MGRSYQQIAESFRIGGEIAVEFFEAHLRAPSIREYTELAMERGGISYDAIRNHHGTYLEWLASVGVQPNPASGFTKNKSGNDLWQRLNTMTDIEFRSLAAEMFAEIDWDAKGAYGSRF